MYTVEYFSNDNEEWKGTVGSWAYNDFTEALEMMRRLASDHPDLPHRIVETKIVRTTVALASQGEELCR